MDFLFGGGVGQTNSSLAAAPANANGATAATAAANPTPTTTSAHFIGHDNGPILYDNLNRTSAIDDIRSVVIYIFIVTIFLSFFLILPGIRSSKFSTFLCIITSLLVTSIIVISLNGTTWHVGEAPISAPYKAFSRDRIQGDLGVRIGLQSVNITLKAHKYYILHAHDGPMIMENMDMVPSSHIQSQLYTIRRVYVDINYNERFYWIEPMQMRREFHQALERGLPYPILTVVEYLSQDDAGFNWSRQYRAAGYYTSMLLWVSASVCVLMFCLHCAAPKYGIYAMQALGVLMLLTNLNYATLVPRGDQKLVIPFEGQSLTFRFGWNFWLVFVGGCLSLLVGTLIVIIDLIFPNFIFTTVLDVEFDTMTQKNYKEKKYKILGRPRNENEDNKTVMKRNTTMAIHSKPKMPPFIRELKRKSNDRKRNYEAQSVNKSEPKKNTVASALSVKLNQIYSSEVPSENTAISRYDPPLLIGDGRQHRRRQEETNENSMQNERVITKDQTIKL